MKIYNWLSNNLMLKLENSLVKSIVYKEALDKSNNYKEKINYFNRPFNN